MARLRMQPGGTHVLSLDKAGRPAVVWAFKDVDFAQAHPTVSTTLEPGETQLRAGQAYSLDSNRLLPVKPSA